MVLLLWSIAPVLQIILSALKLDGKMPLPLFVIFVFALATGITSSFFASNIVVDKIIANSPGRYVCGLPGVVLLIGGLFIAFLSASIIYVAFYFSNLYIQRKAARKAVLAN